MQPLNVVVLQSDSAITQSLLDSLSSSFHSVVPTRSLRELRTSLAKYRAEVVVIDMEVATLRDVGELSREFPQAWIVCTHRLPDDEMWTAALGAGAADICPSSDTRGILSAALRSLSMTRSAAA
jgi:DNA-binding NarL/FixJ family response regulator